MLEWKEYRSSDELIRFAALFIDRGTELEEIATMETVHMLEIKIVADLTRYVTQQAW